MCARSILTIQGTIAAELVVEYRRNHEHVASLVRPLDPHRLLRRPAPDGWSVGEVLEHLILMDGLFLRAIEPRIRAAPMDAAAAGREWAPSWIGRRIAESLQNPKPLKAAKRARPGTPRAGVAEAFLEGDARFAERLEDARRLDWNRIRFRPPVMPWFPLRMNLGDAFRIHGVHVERHTGQIERTLAALNAVEQRASSHDAAMM